MFEKDLRRVKKTEQGSRQAGRCRESSPGAETSTRTLPSSFPTWKLVGVLGLPCGTRLVVAFQSHRDQISTNKDRYPRRGIRVRTVRALRPLEPIEDRGVPYSVRVSLKMKLAADRLALGALVRLIGQVVRVNMETARIIAASLSTARQASHNQIRIISCSFSTTYFWSGVICESRHGTVESQNGRFRFALPVPLPGPVLGRVPECVS